MTDDEVSDRFLGCLLGGAVGDALGAPVEFLSYAEILRRFGPDGITDYAPAYGGLGTITDDTQMTLFTAEGLIRGWVRRSHRGIVSYSGTTALAYLRWLRTQGEFPMDSTADDIVEPGWLFQQQQLHSRRAPGNTCVSALKSMPCSGQPADNDSKGCGGVMRMAPVGLFCSHKWRGQSSEFAFQLGCDLAALTHGHPTGSLPAGVLAVLILKLISGSPLRSALAEAKIYLRARPSHEETLERLNLAEELTDSALSHNEAIARLGQGWVAEEALAISVYCALCSTDFKDGIILSVNHDGDSDSTGAITGNLLGTMHGSRGIPSKWLKDLELRDVISEVAVDLFEVPKRYDASGTTDPEYSELVWRKYPGC